LVCVEERALRSGLAGLVGDRGGALHLPAHTNQFGALLLESIDEALTDLLGRRAREAIYDHLERDHLVARNELADQLDTFVELLQETFGRGSKTIGKVVARRLFSKLDLEFNEIPGYDLGEYVERARDRISREIVSQAKRS
jgi:hypothetical protein